MPHSAFTSTRTFSTLILTVLLWASAFVAIRAGLKGYDPGSLALFRYGIASICLIFLYLPLKKHKPTLMEIPAIFFLGVVGFGIYNIALNYGELTVNSGISSFIVSQIPVGITLFAIIFLKEKLSMQGWIGMAVSIFGVTLIAIGQHQGIRFDMGIVYLLIATLSAGLYAVLHKPLLGKYSPIEFNAYAIWSGMLIMLIYLPKLWQEIPTAPMSATLAAVYLGIFPAVVGYVAWSYVLTHMPASKAGSFLYFMPIAATLMGWLFLEEVPTVISLIGGLVALAGAIIINQRKRAKPEYKNADLPKNTTVT